MAVVRETRCHDPKRIMSTIEEKFPGFYQLDNFGATEALDSADGLAVDRVWLSGNFQETTIGSSTQTQSKKQHELLAVASECVVEAWMFLFIDGS